MCPIGFTNVKSANNQLGCIQTAEAGFNTWEAATDFCFDNFGGRLPTTGEWYISMANYALIGEIGNYEWNDDYGSGAIVGAAENHAVSGLAAISFQTALGDNIPQAFRCWVPR